MQEQEGRNSVVFHTKNKTITITTSDFDDDVDTDDLTKIDYTNIFAEIITIPALLNKVGLLKAEANNELRHKETEFKIFEEELRRRMRQKAKDNGEKPTEKWLEQEIILDPAWRVQQRNLINKQKDVDVIESFYWAIDAKKRSLENFSRNVIPEEYENEIIEGKINSVYVKSRERMFKEK